MDRDSSSIATHSIASAAIINSISPSGIRNIEHVKNWLRNHELLTNLFIYCLTFESVSSSQFHDIVSSVKIKTSLDVNIEMTTQLPLVPYVCRFYIVL